MCVRVSDDVGTFACSVADEEYRTLLQVFCEAVFVDDDRCRFGDLDVAQRSLGFARDDRRSAGEYCCVDFHSAGVYHRNDEAGIPDQVGDDIVCVGDDIVCVGDDIVCAGDAVAVVGDGVYASRDAVAGVAVAVIGDGVYASGDDVVCAGDDIGASCDAVAGDAVAGDAVAWCVVAVVGDGVAGVAVVMDAVAGCVVAVVGDGVYASRDAVAEVAVVMDAVAVVARDDCLSVIPGLTGNLFHSLGHQGVEGTDGEQRLAGAEA